MEIDLSRDKIACFIHSTTLELWKDSFLIVLLDRLKDSGLLAKMSHVCVLNTGLPIDKKLLEEKYAPAQIIHYNVNTLDFENATIRALHTFATFNPSYKILYLHTKGVSYTPNHVFLPGIRSWNAYLLHSLVDHHVKCLRMLKIYDTVGCNYRPFEDGNGEHYSGNFWWANADYVRDLPVAYLKDKYHPEFWLLQNRPTFHNIHTIEHMYEQDYPEENYRESVLRGLDDNVLYCQVGFPCTGLCNQLYNIANALVMASTQEGNKVIILNDFLNDIALHMLEKAPVPEVLDLDAMNAELKDIGITLIYKRDIRMTLDKVEYGLKHVKTIDITDRVREMYYTPNHLCIPQWTDLNHVMGEDPCPQLRKQIYVQYSLNGIPLQKVYHERKLIFNGPVEIRHIDYEQNTDNKIDQHPPIFEANKQWLTRICRADSREMQKEFDGFLQCFRFHSRYYEEANTFLHSIQSDTNQPFNVWHLRNESDAISNWARINGMTDDAYTEAYESKFLGSVRKYMSKDSLNIVLTSFVENNPVIQRLRMEGYQVHARPNLESMGRELNAIIDLIIGFRCTGTFLGNFPMVGTSGSTFSFMIYNYLKDRGVKCIAIDIDDIHHDAYVLENI